MTQAESSLYAERLKDLVQGLPDSGDFELEWRKDWRGIVGGLKHTKTGTVFLSSSCDKLPGEPILATLRGAMT